jgi:pilus assembly protein CpaB
MMVAGLALAGLSTIVGYKALHVRPAVAGTSARPVSGATSNLTLASATRAIAVGETISASLVRNAVGDVNHNPAAATPAEVIGKVATRAIPAGALIQRTMIDAGTKLAIRVPVGMRAMSIDTTAEIAVAGLIRPGDNVDVEAVYPGQDAINGARGIGRSHARTLLQMVPVLAVGELVLGTNTAKAGNGSNGSNGTALTPAARTVTLALTPVQVSTLS